MTTTVEIYIFLYFLLLDKAAEGSKKRSFVWDGGGCDSYRLNGKIEIVWDVKVVTKNLNKKTIHDGLHKTFKKIT